MNSGSMTDLMRGRSFRHAAGGIIAHGTRIVLQMVVGVVLARILLPEAFGVYSYLMAMATIAVVLGLFGMAPIILRDTAKYVVHRQFGTLRTLWKFAAGYCAAMTLLVCCGLYFARYATELLSLEPWSFSILASLVILMVACALLESIVQGLGYSAWSAIIQNMVRPGAYLMLVVVVWLTTGGGDPLQMLQLQVVSQLLAFAALTVMVIALAAKWSAERDAEQAEFSGRALARSSLSFLVIHGLWVIISNTDLLLIGALAGPTEAGLYRVASSAAALTFVGMVALNPLVSERISTFASKNDWVSLQRTAKFAVGASCALAVPLLILFIFAGRVILTLMFGDEYADAGVILTILALGQFLHMAAGFSPAVLAMTGGERVNMVVLTVTAAWNVGLNLLLIPRFGATGAAISTASSLALQTWVMREYLRRRNGIDTSLWSLLKLAKLDAKQ